MAWLSPHRGTTTLYPGADTWVDLPVVTRNTLTGTCVLPKPETEEWPPDASYEEQEEGKQGHIDYKPDTGEAVYSSGINQKMTIRDRGYHMKEQNTWKVNDKDPAHAAYEARTDYTITPPGKELRLMVHFRMASDEKDFTLTDTRQLYENSTMVREKTWNRAIPRGNQ
jgi:uncharacterized protein